MANRARRSGASSVRMYAITIVIGLTGAVLAASLQQSQVPTFRVRTDLVSLDVAVVDGQGRAVTGLPQNVFRVFEDGVEQTIVAFEEVNVQPGIWAAPWLAEEVQDVVTNEAPVGRLIALVIDDALLFDDPLLLQNARSAATRIIDELGPNDRATVVFTRDSRKAQPFTSDRSRLRAAVEAVDMGFLGMGGRAGALGDSLYGVGALRTLEDVVQVLGTSGHFPRSVVYVSLGLSIDWDLVAEPGRVGSGLVAKQQVQQTYAMKLRSILQHAARLNIAVHTMSIEGPRGGGSGEMLRTLSRNTGGLFVTDTDYESGARDIAAAARSVYLIGYTPPTLKPGLRRTEVRVTQAGLHARTRSYYERLKEDAKPASVAQDVAAMSGLLPASEIPLRVAVAPFPLGSTRDAQVAIILGIRHPSVGARATETVRLIVSAYDMEGRYRGGTRGGAEVKMTNLASDSAEYEVYSRLPLPPGRYQLRLSVQHRSRGLTGSVFTDVNVPDFRAEGLHIAGPVLDAGPRRLKAAPPNLFTDFLPTMPTSERSIPTSGRVLAFARIVQGGRQPIRAVNVQTRLVNAQGISTRRTDQQLSEADFRRSRTADFRIGVDGEGMQPGWYLLEIKADDGNRVARRTVSFQFIR